MPSPDNRPPLTFDLFEVNRNSVVLVAERVRQLFGTENCRNFKEALKTGGDISAETRLMVDKQVYDTVGRWFGIDANRAEDLWKRAMKLANSTVNYARGILFPDQEKRATLTTNLVWDDARPSSTLEVLSRPTRLVSESYKYEKGRQLALGVICLEVLLDDERSDEEAILSRMNKYFEDNLFVGREGETFPYPIYSYHTLHTNELVGTGDKKDPPGKGLWVKLLNYPVRKLKIDGMEVWALYDPREKGLESRVIKAKERSLLTAKGTDCSKVIETSPYREDYHGFMFVVMGRRLLRDKIADNVVELLRQYNGISDIKPRDEVNPQHGDPNRVEHRRFKIFLDGLDKTVEGVFRAIGDHIALEYEVGTFDEKLGMHNGLGHPFHKLTMVANIAEYIWPYKIFGIDLEEAKKAASFGHAERLGRLERVIPSRYTD